MSNPVSQRSTVRDAIVALLQNGDACPTLAPLTTWNDAEPPAIAATSIIGWGTGELETLSAAMIAANGIAVIVVCSSGREMGAQEDAVSLHIPIMIMITEQVLLNRGAQGSGLPADYVAEQVLAALKNWQVTGTNYIVAAEAEGQTIEDGSPLRNLFSKDAESGYFTQIVNLKTITQIAPRETA